MDVSRRQLAEGVGNKNTHMSVLMRSTDIWKSVQISVCCFFSPLLSGLRHFLALFLTAVDVLLLRGYMSQTPAT